MSTIYKKIDTSTLEVIETIPATPIKVLPPKIYDYNFLLEQKKNITAQRDEIIALKTAELAEVNALIAECVKLGITVTVAEVAPKEIIV